MSNKRPFDEVMDEFTEEHASDIDQLTPEQIATSTGYSVGTVRSYFRQQSERQFDMKRSREEEQIRDQEAGAFTYVTSSGNARVLYYPLLGEVKIISNHARKRDLSREPWQEGRSSLLLTPQDTLEIGIYMIGLQPHIHDVITRNNSPK